MEKVFLKLVIGTLVDLPEISIGYAEYENVKKGWVVRTKHTSFEGRDGFHKAMEIAFKTTRAISGYRDGDVELWDVIEIFDDESEATKAGKKNGQMSIYQIETAKFKWIW